MGSLADLTAPALAARAVAVRVQFVVAGGPDGDVASGVVVGLDGSVEQIDGPIDDPDVTLTVPHVDATAIEAGTGSLNVSFMSGRTKVAGHTGRLLDVLAAAGG
jgi:hypothetical protein